MDPIDVMTLPGDLNGVADQLNIRRDRTGFAMFAHPLPLASPRVVPQLYCANEKTLYVLDDFFWSPSLNIVPMHLDQAAAFVIGYTQQMRKTEARAHTVWIPTRQNQERLTVLRLYIRANGTFELFAYAPDDPSNWTGGDDYLVAYHRFGA
jgi:hypothetical protein